jgi:hypothetical protein
VRLAGSGHARQNAVEKKSLEVVYDRA